MFKRIIASPRWYGFNFIVPTAGLPVGVYPTGIFLPRGTSYVWFRTNVVTLVGNSPASQIDYGTGPVANAFGSEFEPQFAYGNIFSHVQNLSSTEIFVSVIGDSLLSGQCNYSIFVFEYH